MADPNILRIERVEYHYWPLCECPECQQERERQRATSPHPSKVFSLHPQDAYLLGLIDHSRLSAHGSLARDLLLKRTKAKEVG